MPVAAGAATTVASSSLKIRRKKGITIAMVNNPNITEKMLKTIFNATYLLYGRV
jgi:hypothetical protein